MIRSRSSAFTVILRLVFFIAFLLLAVLAAHLVRDALSLELRPSNEKAVHRAIMLGTAAYIGLLALPFVPGAEIGIAMLAAFGPGIAPLIYVATVTSMMLTYSVGRFLPIALLERFLLFLRLRRAAALVGRAAPLSQAERVAMLMEGQSTRVVQLGLRYRYVALALALNTPGNFIIGGGGGIMLMAGLSGIFSPVRVFVTIVLAVLPVPLAVMVLGWQM